jgi:hypothetical protein
MGAVGTGGVGARGRRGCGRKWAKVSHPRVVGASFARFMVEHERAVGRVADPLELLDDQSGGGFLFDLLPDEPLEKDAVLQGAGGSMGGRAGGVEEARACAPEG